MRRLLAVGTGFGMVCVLLGVLVSSPANAVDVEFTPSTANQSVASLSVSGFSPSDNLLVGVSLANPPAGTSFQFGTTTGLTAGYGYTFSAGLQEISFSGTQADVNTALASMLISTGSSEGDFLINVTATVATANTYFFPDNGHFYKYVAGTAITWTNAQAGAAILTYNGATGYLATVTDEDENTFTANFINAANVWIGGSDAAVEGVWRWATGPEAGTQFWSGDEAGAVTPPFNYASWDAGEPNNLAGGTEDYTATNWRGMRGKWNNLSNLASGLATGYLVEFSPPIGGFTDVTTVTKTAAVVAAPTPTPTPTPTPSPTPTPTPTPTVKKDQEPSTPVALPKSIKPHQWVTLVDQTVTTTADEEVRIRVRCAPLALTLAPLGDVRTCKVKRALSGKVRLKVMTAPTRVTVTLSAPGTSEYKPYRHIKQYNVRWPG